MLNWGKGHLGAAVSALQIRRWTIRRRAVSAPDISTPFPILFYFSSYEEKTIKQAISWMPLSANLLKLESSILPRAKQATNRKNVATEKQIKKKSSGAQ